MKILERVKSWARALEDVEDPYGIELRRLRERVRILEAEEFSRSAGPKRASR